jgi:hypothetical protein
VSVPRVGAAQAVAHRLRVNHLRERLPAGSHLVAARFGLQDTVPRDALLALHARLEACAPDAWEAEGLVQTYGPRQAVYVLPQALWPTFTVGRLPRDPDVARALQRAADDVVRDLDGSSRALPPGTRIACATGRLAIRWDASRVTVREVPVPDDDPEDGRRTLCRLHVAAFGPTTRGAFAWWAGVTPRDARATWDAVLPGLAEVDLDGVRAHVLPEQVDDLLRGPAAEGVRLLVQPDLRLLGRDRTGLLPGPGLRALDPALDGHHPHGVLVDGRLVGAWGRRGGAVDVRLSTPVPVSTREAIEAEALSMPVPGAVLRVVVSGP